MLDNDHGAAVPIVRTPHPDVEQRLRDPDDHYSGCWRNHPACAQELLRDILSTIVACQTRGSSGDVIVNRVLALMGETDPRRLPLAVGGPQ